MIQDSKYGRAAKIGQVLLGAAMVAMEIYDILKGKPTPPAND